MIFEPSNVGRFNDPQFGDIVRTCKFLAKYAHTEHNLRTLADRYTGGIPYSRLRELT